MTSQVSYSQDRLSSHLTTFLLWSAPSIKKNISTAFIVLPSSPDLEVFKMHNISMTIFIDFLEMRSNLQLTISTRNG